MSYTFTPKFQLGEHVFLNVSGSEEHLITNILFNAAYNKIEYQLMDATGQKGWYSQLELTREKVVV